MARPRKHALPSIDEIRARLDYNPDTGEFHHKPRQGTDTLILAWNTRYAGKLAGCQMNGGYWFIRCGRQALLGHRIAWAYYYGEWPDELDHRDGNKLNNRIDNLRPATRRQNNCNRLGRAATGFKGVMLRVLPSGRKRYRAQVASGGVVMHIGTYDTAELAHAAYKRAARRNHKSFANFDIVRVGKIAATIRFEVAA